jgi:hypothetical protein
VARTLEQQVLGLYAFFMSAWACRRSSFACAPTAVACSVPVINRNPGFSSGQHAAIATSSSTTSASASSAAIHLRGKYLPRKLSHRVGHREHGSREYDTWFTSATTA